MRDFDEKSTAIQLLRADAAEETPAVQVVQNRWGRGINPIDQSIGNAAYLAQLRADKAASQADAAATLQAAAQGVAGSGGTLPHLEPIQKSFGQHDVTQVQAHVGGAAKTAAETIGAEAYATGNAVAFRESPSLHTAAHEAAHVVQQRGGVQLKGGVGAVGDRYEQHADAVADAVVQGKSAEALLTAEGTGHGPIVQRRVPDGEDMHAMLDRIDAKLYDIKPKVVQMMDRLVQKGYRFTEADKAVLTEITALSMEEKRLYYTGRLASKDKKKATRVATLFGALMHRRLRLVEELRPKDSIERVGKKPLQTPGNRNFERQAVIFYKKYRGERFRRFTDPQQRIIEIMKFSSLPGLSRHHWGTDVDINSLEPKDWAPGGDDAVLREWLANHIKEFGLSIVYTAGRESGYQPEGWHLSTPPGKAILQGYLETVDIERDVIQPNLAYYRKLPGVSTQQVTALHHALRAIDLLTYMTAINPDLR